MSTNFHYVLVESTCTKIFQKALNELAGKGYYPMGQHTTTTFYKNIHYSILMMKMEGN